MDWQMESIVETKNVTLKTRQFSVRMDFRKDFCPGGIKHLWIGLTLIVKKHHIVASRLGMAFDTAIYDTSIFLALLRNEVPVWREFS